MRQALSRSDVLAAASLLFAIVAVLYSVWYSEIASALETKVPKHVEDAAADRRRVSGVLRTRALPLAVAALVLMFVFLPEAVQICLRFAHRIRDDGVWPAINQYDPVSLSLVLVMVGIGALAGYICWLAARLWMLKRSLTPRRSPN